MGGIKHFLREAFTEVDDVVLELSAALVTRSASPVLEVLVRIIAAFEVSQVFNAAPVADFKEGVAVELSQLAFINAGFAVEAIDVLRDDVFYFSKVSKCLEGSVRVSRHCNAYVNILVLCKLISRHFRSLIC